jgi:hypothetical protein
MCFLSEISPLLACAGSDRRVFHGKKSIADHSGGAVPTASCRHFARGETPRHRLYRDKREVSRVADLHWTIVVAELRRNSA